MPAPATESDTLCVYKRPVRDTLCMYYKRSGIHPAGTHCPANGVAAGRGTLIAQGDAAHAHVKYTSYKYAWHM